MVNNDTVNWKDLIKSGEIDFNLGVSDPTSTGVSAGDGAIARATDGTRWMKVGSSDTDWKKIMFSNDTQFEVTLLFFGDATLNQVFGYHYVEIDGPITAIHASVQVAPTGSDLIIEILKNGTSTGKTITIINGSKNARVSISPKLEVSVGDEITAKITQIGSTYSGGYITLNILREYK